MTSSDEFRKFHYIKTTVISLYHPKCKYKYRWHHDYIFKKPWVPVHEGFMSSISGYSWWRHQMETFSERAGNSPVTGEFPAQRPVTRSFDVLFDLHLNNGEAGDLRRHRAHYDVTVMVDLAWKMTRSVTILHMLRRLSYRGLWSDGIIRTKTRA